MLDPAVQTSLFVSILVSLSAFAFWFAVMRRRRARETPRDVVQRVDRQRLPETLEMEQSFVQRVLKPSLRQLLRRLGRLMPHRNIERLQRNLEGAGRPYDLTVSDFLGLRILVALSMAAGALLLTYTRNLPLSKALLSGLGAGAAGFFLPSYWLKRQIRARQDEIQRAMPDALDMLSIAVTAGLGFDGALQTVGDKWDNALAAEFRKVIREMQVGIPRPEALRNMARRASVTEMSQFVAILVQADQLGLSISKVLETQSTQMRLLRRQRAEELAQQAPLKMLFPLIFLIFPALFVVILGPAVPVMMEIFGNL